MATPAVSSLPLRRFSVLALALLLGACGTTSQSFIGVGPEGKTGESVRTFVTDGQDTLAVLYLRAKGERDVEAAGVQTDRMRIDFEVDNSSDEAIEVPIDRLRLEDDSGRAWRFAEWYGFENQDAGSVVRIPARTRQSFAAGFDAGARHALEVTGSVTLSWQYLYRGESVNKRTRFIPAPRTVYIERQVGFGVGYGRWYGDPYYYGWPYGW